MGNILDYVRWRGDLSFAASPFNELDSLLLTQLAFIDLHAVKGAEETPTLSELEARFFEIHDRATFRLGIYFPKGMAELLTLSAKSARFSSVKLLDAEEVRDPEKKIQFTAMTFLLPDKTLYVAYRGTDDTLYGWYESLSLGVFDTLPIHTLAKGFLERVVTKYRYKRVRVGGHSKGGHLALTASLALDARYHRRILGIYNFDGPGFRRDMRESESYLALSDRIYSITPYMAIVGALLCGLDKVDVVESDGKGVFQHDVFNWHVEGVSLVRLDKRCDESLRLEKSLKGWLLKVDDRDRLKFIDALYRVLTSSGAVTISEISEDKLGSAYQFSKTMLTFDKETREVASRAVLLLLRERKQTLREKKEVDKQMKKNKKSSDSQGESDESIE